MINHPPEDIRFELRNWWMGEKTTALRKSLYGDREGYHATPSEIAVTWSSFPEQQRDVKLGPLEKVTRAYQGPEDFRKLFPDGRMGSDPSLATPEDGKRLVSLAVDELVNRQRYEAFSILWCRKRRIRSHSAIWKQFPEVFRSLISARHLF